MYMRNGAYERPKEIEERKENRREGAGTERENELWKFKGVRN